MYALHERHAQARQWAQWPFGILASTVANYSMYAPKKALEPADFGLGPRAKRTSGCAVSVEGAAHDMCNAFRLANGKPLLPAIKPEAPDVE
jgi:hypothetical protein